MKIPTYPVLAALTVILLLKAISCYHSCNTDADCDKHCRGIRGTTYGCRNKPCKGLQAEKEDVERSVQKRHAVVAQSDDVGHWLIHARIWMIQGGSLKIIGPGTITNRYGLN